MDKATAFKVTFGQASKDT